MFTQFSNILTLLHSEQSKLHRILAVRSATGLIMLTHFNTISILLNSIAALLFCLPSQKWSNLKEKNLLL